MEQNSEKKHGLPLTIWIFLLFVFGFAIVNLIVPDRSFSPLENRVLSEAPDFSLKALLNGDWTQEFETYITDQFVFRDVWVGTKAASERALLKTENGGIYFAKEDTLIERPTSADSSVIRTNISSINTFRDSIAADVSFALIPNTVTLNRELLPAFADDGNQEAAVSEAYSQLKNVNTADIDAVLTEAKQKEGSALFYRTDHHPTTLGAYYIYRGLSNVLDFTPHELSEYSRETVSTDFYGTARSQSGAWWVHPDSIDFFTLSGEEYTLETYENNTLVSSQEGLYVRENLAITDKYTAFLGGNHPLLIIKNHQQHNGKKILLIKDSFSHCIAPFLANHYEEIHLVDLRYYRSHLTEYVKEQGFDDVLILYSVENFLSEKNLVYLNL